MVVRVRSWEVILNGGTPVHVDDPREVAGQSTGFAKNSTKGGHHRKRADLGPGECPNLRAESIVRGKLPPNNAILGGTATVSGQSASLASSPRLYPGFPKALKR